MAETVKKGARITGADRAKLAGELTKKYAGSADRIGGTSLEEDTRTEDVTPQAEETAQPSRGEEEPHGMPGNRETVTSPDNSDAEQSGGAQAVGDDTLAASQRDLPEL